MISEAYEFIRIPLLHIFRLSLSCARLPTAWQQILLRNTAGTVRGIAACNAMLNGGTGSPAEDKPKAPPAASDEDTESEDGDDADPLPDGWEAVVSRSTGQTYYHHIESGETTYDYPTAPKQLAAVYASHPLFCCS